MYVDGLLVVLTYEETIQLSCESGYSLLNNQFIDLVGTENTKDGYKWSLDPKALNDNVERVYVSYTKKYWNHFTEESKIYLKMKYEI